MVIIGIVVYPGKNIVALEHLDGLVEGTVFLGHRNYREEKKGGGEWNARGMVEKEH